MIRFLFIISLLASYTFLNAQNDNCSTAITIVSSTLCNPLAASSASATQSMPGCVGNADDDVWFQFIASSPTQSLAITPSSGYDAVLEVFSGNCTALTSLNCIDNNAYGTAESVHLTNLSIGSTYYFRVYEYHIGAGSNTFSVCLTDAPTPINDECINAITITTSSVCSFPINGSSYFGTQSMIGCSGNADDDVWFKFVATNTTQSLTVNTSANYDAVVEIFSGSCGTLTSMSCNDFANAGSPENIHLLGLTVGNTYYFRVYDFHLNSGSNNFSICLIDTPIPANDECSGAFAISTSSSSTCTSPLNGTSNFGTQSMVGCAGDANDDVWYKFIATSTSHSIVVSPSNSFDAVIELFSGSCGVLTSMNCIDIAGSGVNETLHKGGFTVGNTYYIRIYDYHTNPATSTFTICITTPPILPPSNDECLGAFSLSVTPNCLITNTVVTSLGATQSQVACTGNADDDIWFSFVAPINSVKINATGQPLADAVIEFFSGNCAALNSLNCKDVMFAGQTESLVQSGLTIGQTYYFRVYEFNNSGGATFTVNIERMELLASSSSTASAICLGQPITLSASGTPSFTWSSGVLNGVAFTPTASATYTATGIGTGSCVNTATITVNVSVPQIPTICMVTNDTANIYNEIYWDKYSYDKLDSMIVYRETTTNIFTRIGAVYKTAFSRFKDTARHIGFRNGDPNIRSYKYKLQIRDTCGNYSALSPYHTSLFLNNDAIGNFTWNFYDIEGQTSTVNNYELYRDDFNTGVFNLIGTVTATLGVSSYTFTYPGFGSFANARWGVTGDGFSCNPSFKIANPVGVLAAVVKTKGNIKNNFVIPNPPADPDPQGVREYSSDISVLIMPNPASTSFDIVSEETIVKINVFNNLGDAVYTSTGAYTKQWRINTSDFSNGIYSIEIITTKARGLKKVVISK